MLINSISDFRAAMRRGKYTFPGCYPCYFITSDGEALSFEAAKECRREILQALADNDSSGWRVVAVDVNYEDADLICAHTGNRIESAYAEDED